MAQENERLKELLESHGIDPMSGILSNEIKTNQKNSLKISTENPSFEQSDKKYPINIRLRIENASGTMNGLSVAYGSFHSEIENDFDAIISGGVDKILRIYNLTGELQRQFEFSAPILSIETYGSLISCTFMDGGHALVSFLLLSLLVFLQYFYCFYDLFL